LVNREGQYAQEFNARPRINMHGDSKDVTERCVERKQASEVNRRRSEYIIQEGYWQSEHFGEVPGSTRAKV
jgi:hypothetical protein